MNPITQFSWKQGKEYVILTVAVADGLASPGQDLYFANEAAMRQAVKDSGIPANILNASPSTNHGIPLSNLEALFRSSLANQG